MAHGQALFHVNNSSRTFNNNAAKGQLINVNQNYLQQIIATRPSTLQLAVPLVGKQISFELEMSEIGTKDFTTVLASDFSEQHNLTGWFMHGKPIDGGKGFIAISFFENELMAVVNDGVQNYSIGKSSSNEYIMVIDKDVDRSILPKCWSDELSQGESNYSTVESPRTGLGCVVDIYVEAAYQLYLSRGSDVSSTINYVAGIFNITQTIFQNESIDVQLREVKVWNVADPENALTTTTTVLNSFATRMGTSGFNGDLAHYFTSKGIGGGRAYLNVLNATAANRTGVSGNLSAASIPEFPTYSFTAMVVAHELGHNMGSNHTQWCGWPGGAIDNCYTTEGGCAAGPAPVGGGTIMSYCHLAAPGINLSNGFGTLPGNTVRNAVAASSAICNCNNIFATIDKSDEGCGGSNNGAARANIEGGIGPFTFLWNTGSTAAQITGLAPGDYYVTITSAVTGCTLTKGVKIKAGATAIAVPRTPSETSATECIGSNVVLTAHPLGGSGSYAYQWYNGATLLAGETSNTYTVNNTGNYFVQVTSGSCLSNSSSFNATFVSTPLPTITANKIFPICSYENVTFSVSPNLGFIVEWFKDGTLIAGATGATYTTNVTGTYSAKLKTLGSCEANSNTIFAAINPAPIVSTLPNRFALLCDGQTITMTALSSVGGSTFQWYYNGSLIAGATSNIFGASLLGAYKVQVTTPAGCSTESAIVYFERNSKVPFNVINNTALTFCEGDSVKLKAVITAGGQGSTTGQPTGEIFNYQWYKDGSIISGANYDSIYAKASGVYAVKVGSDKRCDSIKNNIVVLVHPKPVPTMLSSLGWVVAGGSTTVLSTPIAYSSYQWYKDGSILPGEIMSTLSTGIGGTYKVEVTDANGCKNFSIDYLLIVNVILSNNQYYLQGKTIGLRKQLWWGKVPSTLTVLQRSTNEQNFDDIYQGEANIYADESLQPIAWYRLKIVNAGHVKYSNIVKLKNIGNNGISIYPNPTKDVLIIQLQRACGDLRLMDKQGRVLMHVAAVSTKTAINLSHLPAGQYYILQYCQSSIVGTTEFVKE